MGGSRYRYSESRIHPNDLLYALGLFQTVHAESASEQTETETAALLNEWKKDHQALLAKFDTNQDGEIDMKEWNRARQEAAGQAHSYVLENYDSEPAHILCQSPVRHQHFILACKNPLKLAKQYRWKSLALFLVFIGLVALDFNLVQSLVPQ
jgi:DNA mismatch repair ATPase MutS